MSDDTPYHPNSAQQEQVNRLQGVVDGTPDFAPNDSVDRGIKIDNDGDMGTGADVVGPDERPIEDHYAPAEDRDPRR